MNALRILALTIVITSAVLSAQTGATPWTTPTLAEVDAIYPDVEALYMDLRGGRVEGRRGGVQEGPSVAVPFG